MSMLESEELMERRERESTMEREGNGRTFVQAIYCFHSLTQRLTIRQQQKSNKQQPFLSRNRKGVDNH
jgi:hypothetical protein